ncbi:helix-turn-helix transcriptional regulator [Desulfotruncus arcticus]|uniref:helix-turn-helix transcriptional regulator n=1 Tax=Desulfotruncus arcticus TaxID=341036 RepID=UPI0013F4D468|nr:helix-turn-helix transcriptional regulator [Desulfotruncus arcticus]
MENNLKAWREQRGFSQQQLTDLFRNKYGKSTITYQHISTWERGRMVPLLENAMIYAKILGVTMEELFILDE